ncbi:hypothetical protein ZOSMA_133G00180 [Zostera marina]|uniref:Uncharacterized protein n=1 Tax=Zostera marina TaxID=29655 RepID=A0A0K9PYP6_ZOSMR|nr:hypothetical protein ZOSMA_133G00180 [Zostera marina]
MPPAMLRSATVVLVVSVVFILLSGIPTGKCQSPDGAVAANDGINNVVTGAIYNKLSNLTETFHGDVGDGLDYCILDRQLFLISFWGICIEDRDWDEAFNFSSNLTFMTQCFKQSDDLLQRICNAAEIKFYFSGLYGSGERGDFLKPNKNCNLSSWVSGCEPGWGCSVGGHKQVDLKDSKNTPSRTMDCRPCCEGFFCPQGITCMIPCPLGSYCPKGELNRTTGLCYPYRYQLPPGRPDHTCGGADIWADIKTDSDIFCPAGYYCPTTTKKLPCEPGYYCRKGSTTMQSKQALTFLYLYVQDV